jgi:hypothetical protein
LLAIAAATAASFKAFNFFLAFFDFGEMELLLSAAPPMEDVNEGLDVVNAIVVVELPNA